jgi:hypothetical protein
MMERTNKSQLSAALVLNGDLLSDPHLGINNKRIRDLACRVELHLGNGGR